ncbi:MAG: hypothetical protein HQK77_15065 [Desulfobacterales bacterium]|nr:hypothetical protein [Desulfobacterales bacterium]
MKINEFPAPECPIHPQCRCCLIAVMKPLSEYGLSIDTLQENIRPYTLREDRPIMYGNNRKVLDYGEYKGNYSEFYKDQSDQFQINVIGKKRKALIDSGKITFDQLVDKRTGRLLTIEELTYNAGK